MKKNSTENEPVSEENALDTSKERTSKLWMNILLRHSHPFRVLREKSRSFSFISAIINENVKATKLIVQERRAQIEEKATLSFLFAFPYFPSSFHMFTQPKVFPVFVLSSLHSLWCWGWKSMNKLCNRYQKTWLLWLLVAIH